MVFSWLGLLCWVGMWLVGRGLPELLFAKKIGYYHRQPVLHLCWFVITSAFFWIGAVKLFDTTLGQIGVTQILWVLLMAGLWVLIPKIPGMLRHDYFTKTERRNYQIAKFGDVIAQQVPFYIGLAIMGLGPIWYGILFFSIHLLLFFSIPWKHALAFATVAGLGGIIFALLQHHYGLQGFMISVGIHLAFYTIYYIYVAWQDRGYAHKR